MYRVHKRIIKNYLTSGGTRTRSEKILALFVDSGVLYTALWVRTRLSPSCFLRTDAILGSRSDRYHERARHWDVSPNEWSHSVSGE